MSFWDSLTLIPVLLAGIYLWKRSRDKQASGSCTSCQGCQQGSCKLSKDK